MIARGLQEWARRSAVVSSLLLCSFCACSYSLCLSAMVLVCMLTLAYECENVFASGPTSCCCCICVYDFSLMMDTMDSTTFMK